MTKSPWSSVPEPSVKDIHDVAIDLLTMITGALLRHRNKWLSTDEVFDVLATKWENFHPDCEQREPVKERCIIIAKALGPEWRHPYKKRIRIQMRMRKRGYVLASEDPFKHGYRHARPLRTPHT